MLEKVWTKLPSSLRDDLLRKCVLDANRNEGFATDLSILVADMTNARPQSVRSQWRLGNLQGLRIAAAKAPHRAATFLPTVFINHHRSELASLYDELGVRHDGGRVSDEDAAKAPSVERFLAALRSGSGTRPDGFTLAMVATIADAGIKAWRPAAAEAVHAYMQTPLVEEAPSPAPVPPSPATTPAAVEATPSEEPPPESVAPTSHAGEPTPSHAPPEPANPLSPHTALDRLVIDTIVHAMNATVGACSPEEAEEIVEEIVALNDSRFSSYFHRGFLHALRGDPLREMARGENQPRRSWYLAGFLSGCRRTDDARVFVDRLRSMSPLDRRTIRGSAGSIPPPAPVVSPMIVSAALEVDESDLAMEWFHAVLSLESVHEVARWALEKLRNGGHGIALPVLQRMHRHLGSLQLQLRREVVPDGAMEPLETARMRIRRLEATALRMASRFDEAGDALSQLVVTDRLAADKAAIAGGIALAKLHLPRIEQIDLRDQSIDSLLRRVRALEARLVECDAGPDSYPPGLILLALPGILGKHPTDAERKLALARLRTANDVMALAPERWATTGASCLARGLLALATLCGMSESSAEAASTLAESLAAGLILPTKALATAAECAALLDAPEVVAIGKHLLDAAGPAQVLQLPIAEMIQQSPLFAAVVAAAMEAWSVPDREWAELATAVLRGLRRARSRDQATVDRCVDGLEVRAARDSRARTALASLLGVGVEWEIGWSQEERDHLLVRLHLQDNRLDEAADLVQSLGFSSLSRGDRALAEDCAEELDRIGHELSSQCGLRARLAATASPQSLPAGDDLHPWIALVGGNEVQAAYSQRLREWFERQWPNGRLRIDLPGWGANWKAEIADLDKKLDRYDAVVLLTLVRTNLGRHIRRRASEVGIPWIPCTGHGLESLRRAVSAAVRVAARQGKRHARSSGS